MTRKELSFVPPDGSFTLMGYRVDRPQGSTITAAASSVPLALKPTLQLGEEGGPSIFLLPFCVPLADTFLYPLGQFEIIITSKLPSSRTLENVRVSFYLGAGAGSVSATIGLGVSNLGQGSGGVIPGKGRAKEGGWGWNLRTHVSVCDSSEKCHQVLTISGGFNAGTDMGYPRTRLASAFD